MDLTEYWLRAFPDDHDLTVRLVCVRCPGATIEDFQSMPSLSDLMQSATQHNAREHRRRGLDV